jgi:hypothetical protein
MSNIKVDYGEVHTVNNKMKTMVTDTLPRLKTLQDVVTGLLAPGGGLLLRRAGADIATAYLMSNQQVNDLFLSVEKFAEMFANVISQLDILDQEFADSMSGSTGSPGTNPGIP